MNAPKGTNSRADESLTKDQRLLADPRFCKALEEFKRRLAKPSGRAQAGAETNATMQGFIDKLPTLLVDAVTPPAFWQAKSQKAYVRMLGQTQKSLKEFPDQIRRMATKIEKLSGSLFFAPRRDDDRRYFGKVHALPNTLRWYASWVELQSEKVPPSGKQCLPLEQQGLSPAGAFHFSLRVKKVTGKLHDKYVAALLDTADLVLNPRATNRAKDFDATALVKLRSRLKHKPLKRGVTWIGPD